MHSMIPTTFAMALAIFCVLESTSTSDSVIRFQSMLDDDWGQVNNCGNINFSASWSPKTLSGYKSAKIKLDYTFPQTLSGGIANITVWYYGDDEPFLVYPIPFSCDDIKRMEYPCPLPKGLRINKTLTIDYTKALRGFPGTYRIVANVTNQDKKAMICANLTVTIDDN